MMQPRHRENHHEIITCTDQRFMALPPTQLEATTILSFKDRGNKKELLNNGFGAPPRRAKCTVFNPGGPTSRNTNFAENSILCCHGGPTGRGGGDFEKHRNLRNLIALASLLQ